MTLTWETRGTVYQGRYTQQFPDFPAGTWATGELSRKPDQVENFMRGAQVNSRVAVAALSRVDTGRMRGEVESYLSGTDEQHVLDFGWWEGNPHYAPYQEFGTRTGIEAMLAVHSVFVAEFDMLKDVMSS